jgi:hypothetical protein
MSWENKSYSKILCRQQPSRKPSINFAANFESPCRSRNDDFGFISFKKPGSSMLCKPLLHKSFNWRHKSESNIVSFAVIHSLRSSQIQLGFPGMSVLTGPTMRVSRSAGRGGAGRPNDGGWLAPVVSPSSPASREGRARISRRRPCQIRRSLSAHPPG